MLIRTQVSGRVLAFVLPVVFLGIAQAVEPPLQKRGEYLFRLAGCAACHTDRDRQGAYLAGGPGLVSEFGTFYPPNITPDRRFGIGAWSQADFLRAMLAGIRPDGAHYYPSFPYPAYARLERAEVLAIKAYLDSVPPVAQANRPHELPWWLSRTFIWVWKALYFRPGTEPPEPGRSDIWQRGRHIVGALGHCGQCHTPRDGLGGPDLSRLLAGTARGPGGKRVPNITPHRKTGIGAWNRGELSRYLRTGERPDSDFAGGLMAEVIDESLSKISDPDLKALTEYLRSVASVENKVRKSKSKQQRYDFE